MTLKVQIIIYRSNCFVEISLSFNFWFQTTRYSSTIWKIKARHEGFLSIFIKFHLLQSPPTKFAINQENCVWLKNDSWNWKWMNNKQSKFYYLNLWSRVVNHKLWYRRKKKKDKVWHFSHFRHFNDKIQFLSKKIKRKWSRLRVVQNRKWSTTSYDLEN